MPLDHQVYRDAGIKVLTDYPGVYPDSDKDSLPGWEHAAADAYSSKTSLFVPGFEYTISDTLPFLQFQTWDTNLDRQITPPLETYAIVGDSSSKRRARIKLMKDAPGFQDKGNLRAVVAFRNIEALNSGGVNPPSVWDNYIDLPAGWKDGSNSYFNNEFRYIDIDTNGNPGAVALFAPQAQCGEFHHIRIYAYLSHIAVWGLPGRTTANAGIEIYGGDYQLFEDPVYQGGRGENSNGIIIAGVKLIDAEIASVRCETAGGIMLIGSEIKKREAPVVLMDSSGLGSGNGTANGMIALIESSIEVEQDNGDPVIDNRSEEKNLYIEDATFKVPSGASLIQSGTLPPVVGTGPYIRVRKYAHRNPITATAPYSSGDNEFDSVFVQDGVELDPSVREILLLENNSGPPDFDLYSRWVPNIPAIEQGPYVDVVKEFGVRPASNVRGGEVFEDINSNGPIHSDAIEAAMLLAEQEGHNRVFLGEVGNYYVNRELMTRSNTILFGIAKWATTVSPHISWRPTSGEHHVIRTPDDPDASPVIACMEITTPTWDQNVSVPEYPNVGVPRTDFYDSDVFGFIHIQSGNAETICCAGLREVKAPDVATNAIKTWLIDGNGGGRFWAVGRPNFGVQSTNPYFRELLIQGTRKKIDLIGTNFESPDKNVVQPSLDACIEFNDVHNVRMFGSKKEKKGRTLLAIDCNNIASYMSSIMREEPFSNQAFFEFQNCQNVLVANVHNASMANDPPNTGIMLRESGQSVNAQVDFPRGVTLFERGNFNARVFRDQDTLKDAQGSGLLPAGMNRSKVIFSSKFGSGVGLTIVNDATRRVTGDDGSFKGNWFSDLASVPFNPDRNSQVVDLFSGTDVDRDYTLVADPLDSSNTVSRLSLINDHESGQGRIAHNLYMNPGFYESLFSRRILIPADVASAIQSFPSATSISIEIYQTDPSFLGTGFVNQKSSVSIIKAAGAGQPLVFALSADGATDIVGTVPVPTGEWFTLLTHWKAGFGTNGRLSVAVVDASGGTSYLEGKLPTNTGVNEVIRPPSFWQPVRLFVDADLIDHVRPITGSLDMYVDEWEINQMATVSDAKFVALQNLGYTGHISDMTLQWLQANGAVSPSISDAWREMVASKGFDPASGGWFELLRSLGYTGDLNQMQNDFWANGGVFP